VWINSIAVAAARALIAVGEPSTPPQARQVSSTIAGRRRLPPAIMLYSIDSSRRLGAGRMASKKAAEVIGDALAIAFENRDCVGEQRGWHGEAPSKKTVHRSVRLRFGFQRGALHAAVGGLGQQLDLLFRRAEHAAAMLDQEIPALVFREAFLQPDAPALDLREDSLQFGKGFLNVRGGIWFFWPFTGIIMGEGVVASFGIYPCWG